MLQTRHAEFKTTRTTDICIENKYTKHSAWKKYNFYVAQTKNVETLLCSGVYAYTAISHKCNITQFKQSIYELHNFADWD